MLLPKFQSDSREVGMLQTQWASILDPVIGRTQNQSNILSGVILINGTTVVNHLLGRQLTGWKIVRQNALAAIYDSQDSNQTPQLTLVLISDAVVTVSIEVF